MPSLHDLLREYLDARGLTITDGDNVGKVVEEARELEAECLRESPDHTRIRHELADVVLAATVLAEHHGFAVEDAIRDKIAFDAGRESRR